jgi:hypothetical protein
MRGPGFRGGSTSGGDHGGDRVVASTLNRLHDLFKEENITPSGLFVIACCMTRGLARGVVVHSNHGALSSGRYQAVEIMFLVGRFRILEERGLGRRQPY